MSKKFAVLVLATLMSASVHLAEAQQDILKMHRTLPQEFQDAIPQFFCLQARFFYRHRFGL